MFFTTPRSTGSAPARRRWARCLPSSAIRESAPARLLGWHRAMVITEFDAGDPEATLHALADEILKYRRAVRLLAKATGWADAGAPFALIAPGPLPAAKRARVTGSDA